MALALMAVGACATIPTLSPREVSEVRSGEQSAIIMSYRAYKTMFWATVGFENATTGETFLVEMYGGNQANGPNLGIVAVPPGRYRIGRSSVTDASAIAGLPLFSYWFDEFEIGAGEVLDMGTLNLHDVDVRSTATMGDHLARLISDGNLAGRYTYMAYSIDYSSDEHVRQLLMANHPELEATPIRRPLRILLDRAEFERAVAESYAPQADGTPPTVAEAHARVNATLERLVRNSRQATGSAK